MKYILILLFLLPISMINGQIRQFTDADSLRGGNNSERSWWDLTYYDLYVEVYPEKKWIEGRNVVRYQVKRPHAVLQLDLQDPLKIVNITQDGQLLKFTKKYSSYLIELQKDQKRGEIEEIIVTYEGHPTESIRPPWSGGITWDKDKNGNWFIANSNQTAGASIWWPCKDHPADEVDSMQISVNVPRGLQDVSNGRLRSITEEPDGRRTFHWFVSNPINSYGVNINIADYVHFSEVYQGKKGPLTCDYYVLPYNLEKAQKQFKQATKMLEAFEYWLGPYPFYEDGYKLVEAPYLGMEHQSSVTYGNQFENGYLGRDLSHTGWGMKFDFIIIHESAHEWFANNITYADLADMWIHESLTNYSESLYVEYYHGKEAGAEYVRGMRANTQNNCPLQGAYGVHDQGCGGADMYYKGSNMWHTLRQIVNNDEQWRSILRGLNETFYHQTVLAADVEGFVDAHTDVELKPFFDQYVRDARIPVFSYWVDHGVLRYRYDNTIEDFAMPIQVWIQDRPVWLYDASNEWQSTELPEGITSTNIRVDPDFYVASFDLGVEQERD
ncbi:M1 family metallopeptidase [Membranicola marinus]|uniref:M1 family metallopeptidase n=1 Tax=Membranihabitans marinus TaxID=1227546 RepID=A0A953HJF2_9BACT|nr:M1 family metallopeptidase [Membranihabitans marinus]MBY5956979.1 M1 family metallopeptidase [Membranihabitans marinus]